MVNFMSKLFCRNIFVIALLFINISACVPLVLGAGAGVVGGKVMLQDKTIGESASDTTIWTKIRATLLKSDVVEPGNINIEVNEGRVLLTGFVQSDQDIIKVLKIVWAQIGVKEVINELKIQDKWNETSAFDDMRDGWITTKIKAKLLLESDVKSTNYTIETINSIVYIFGIASNEQELNIVKNVAENITNVKQVVSYVRIRKDLEQRIQDTVGVSSEVKKSSNTAALDEEEKDDPDEGGETLENIFDDKL